MIDCGADWLGRLKVVDPTAIVLTHAHSDHASGLGQGACCPVYATEETWSLIERFPLADRHVIEPRRPFRIGRISFETFPVEHSLLARISFETFPVEHSLLAPTVGYRVTEGRVAFFYVPDLASSHELHDALNGVALYIGDGATVTRSMVRRRSRELIGHATIGAQLVWCRLEGVGRAIFTHCGSEIVRSDARAIAARIRKLGFEQGVDARVADDGLMLPLPG